MFAWLVVFAGMALLGYFVKDHLLVATSSVVCVLLLTLGVIVGV